MVVKRFSNHSSECLTFFLGHVEFLRFPHRAAYFQSHQQQLHGSMFTHLSTVIVPGVHWSDRQRPVQI